MLLVTPMGKGEIMDLLQNIYMTGELDARGGGGGGGGTPAKNQ